MGIARSIPRTLAHVEMRLAVRIPAVKSPLYLVEDLPGGQVCHVLWHWPIKVLSQKNYLKKKW